MPTNEELARTYVAETQYWLTNNVGKIKHCLNQLTDEQVWWRPQGSMNSIANLIMHLCGNIRQRIVSTVGREPDNRDRPSEFTERVPIPKAELMRRLSEVVERADAVLARQDTDRLAEARRYQGLGKVFDGTVLSTILHCLLHLSGHVQEIIYITRLQLGEEYEFQATPSSPHESDRT